MLTKSVTRQEFLDLLQAKGVVERYDLHSVDHSTRFYASSGELQLFWRDDDLPPHSSGSAARTPSLPRIIGVESGKVRDFLAWVWTYVPDFRPLTAYVRVLDASEMQFAEESSSKPSLAGLEEACLGLILTEAVTYIESAPDRQPNVTPLACASTFSNAMARALALSKRSGAKDEYQHIMGNWLKARSLTQQRQLRLGTAELGLPWKVLLRLYDQDRNGSDSGGGEDEIYRICRELMQESETGSATWDTLSRKYPLFDRAWSEMQGPREKRVTFFEDSISSLAELRRQGPELPGFFCGFLASQIGPGTLDYIPLLAPHLSQFPTAIIWYGLCSGLQHRGSIYAFSFGLGRRVLREVLREETILQSPQSDIALAELEVMTASDAANAEFRTGAQGLLEIEIVPMVTTTVRWPPKQIAQPELFPADTFPFELRELNLQLDELRSKTTQIQRRISRLIGDRDTSEWKPGKGRRR